ncbi:hypothetical protein I3760_01G296300 [Carya illinoinensis]|nr:hypothetical protein I3760_01G296300 [Carya illinoinensis]
MGGIGKTTIAKAVYNEIYLEFEGSSFLLNIKEISEKPDGLVRLQEQLLSDVLKTKNLKISNVDGGITLIKERFRHKRVLIVLDDVDHLNQLYSLAGEFEWFGPGSRVIATTRDEQMLTLLGVNEKYEVEELNHEESLQLFSWHAFRMTNPVEEYLKLSTDVVGYVGGLPLALEVLGSSLLRRSIIEWKSTLEKLQKVPDKQIQGKLRISFDSLDVTEKDIFLRISFDSLDVTEKDIFLDIACFFIGTDKEYVNRVLDGCCFFPAIGLGILIQRSLLTVNERNELRMHDLIRDMGREIVREESPNDLGERNRLWFHEDVLNVLRKHTGTKAVQGLVLNLPTLEDVHLETEAFREMKNLRLLQIDGVYLKGCYELLPKELKWLCWHKCPLQFLPPNFQLESLAVLDMQHSHVKQVWREIKIFNKLKVLNMSNSINLTKSPNLLGVPLLEIMILEGCTSLTEIHESIGHLKSLVLLNLKGCKNLRHLPRSISNSKSFETLNLSGCSKLTMLPEDLGYMMALRELRADKTAIKRLPSSFGLLTNLQTLTLSGCKGQASESWISRLLSGILPSSNPTNLLPASISGLCSLRELDLSDCNLREDGIPIDFGSLSSLEELDLSSNSFLKLPTCMSRLPKLAKLRLNDCKSLQSISELPTSVTELKAARCTSLERVSNLFNVKRWSSISLSECNKLVEIQGLEKLQFAITHTDEGYNVSYFFSKNIFQSSNLQSQWSYPFHPGRDSLDRFSHTRVGSSISCYVPPLSEGKIVGVDVCAIFAPKKETTAEPLVRTLEIKSRFFTNQSHWFDKFREVTTFMTSIPMSNFKAGMASGEEINVSFDFGEAFEVNKCGISLRLIEEAKPDVIDEDEQGSLVKDGYFVTCADTAMDMVYMKRGRDEHEGGSSNDWSIQESCPKRSRMEAEV